MKEVIIQQSSRPEKTDQTTAKDHNFWGVKKQQNSKCSDTNLGAWDVEEHFENMRIHVRALLQDPSRPSSPITSIHQDRGPKYTVHLHHHQQLKMWRSFRC
eukprot:gnl/TRDRNA2_/TRDRNA2_172893_c7_seq10.p1 gnl/TRDRNA2_/TRDRNA2_172893_c7~~gnl/TRDRNA2_/TRDRNA2_172893_c7_seq10.p1  ORF type:complete len:101 (-),score=5.74 gnl/TRDRNA2_/TRDRNA2_172893_c7_seq10:370-672(-)